MPPPKQRLLALSAFGALALLLLLGLAFVATPQRPPQIMIAAALAWVALLWIVAMQIRRQAQIKRKIQLGLHLLREQDYSVRLARVGHPEVDQVTDLFNTLAAKLKADRLRLNEQGYLLQNLIRSSPLAIVQLDYDYRITDLNLAALNLLGISDPEPLLGLHALDHQVPFPFQLALLPAGQSAVARNASAAIYQYTWSSFRDRGFTRPLLTIEVLTETMFEAERKTYSQFVRLCAHEVNNAAGSINSIIDTTLEYLSATPEAGLYQEALGIAQERMATLSQFIERVASMVKIPPPNLQPADAGELLRSLQLEYALRYAPKDIEVNVRVETPTPSLLLDATLITQVLENIIRNAAQSIGRKGQITLALIQDPQWQIVIADNGPGIPQAAEAQLFTPFYTTKSGGQGLGLLLCHEILRGHRFNFRLSTESDGITRFRIFIPESHLAKP